MFSGGLWPVVQRELRETARRPINHWLRLGGALGGVVMLCVVTSDLPFSSVGTELFSHLHVLLLCLICGLVPALTADCIARERRDGTLGLLFMTPLTASSIVVGKVLAQVLRSLTLWLALMPLLTIPFLCGGVTWNDVAVLLIMELCAGMMCLAAGMLASSLTDNRAIAFILAFLLTGAFVGGSLRYQFQIMTASQNRRAQAMMISMASARSSFVVYPAPSVPAASRMAGQAFWIAPNAPNNLPVALPNQRPLMLSASNNQNLVNQKVQALFSNSLVNASNLARVSSNAATRVIPPASITNFGRRVAPRFRSPPPGIVYGGIYPGGRGFPGFAGAMPFFTMPAPLGFSARQPPPIVLLQGFFLAALVLLFSIRFAGWCVERSWHDKTPSIRRQGWVKRYCSPIFKNWFARKMQETMQQNPIAWLQQYSWKARLSKWGLCLLFLVLECSFVDGNDLTGFARMLSYLLVVLVAAYTFAGVNGFLQEKKSGALELILVSPISVNQLIFGRVWGLWKQFLPSVLVLVGSDFAFHTMVGEHFSYYRGSWETISGRYLITDIEIIAIYLTLPVVATCFALSSKNLFVASSLTVALVIGPALMVLFPGLLVALLASLLEAQTQTMYPSAMLLLALVPLPVLAAHGFSAMMAYGYLHRSLGRRSYAY